MDLGIHLPLMQFGDEELSHGRLEQAVTRLGTTWIV
jgi:muramidase (phage lysozyme)